MENSKKDYSRFKVYHKKLKDMQESELASLRKKHVVITSADTQEVMFRLKKAIKKPYVSKDYAPKRVLRFSENRSLKKRIAMRILKLFGISQRRANVILKLLFLFFLASYLAFGSSHLEKIVYAESEMGEKSPVMKITVSKPIVSEDVWEKLCKEQGKEYRNGICTSLPSEVEENEVLHAIYVASKKYGVSYTLLREIARCESGFRPNAKNGTSTASGLYQWIKGSWMGYVRQRGLDWNLDDRFDAKKASDMTAYVISRGGLHNWDASKSCHLGR